MQQGAGKMQKGEAKQMVKTFTDLHAWQEGHRLVVAVFKLTARYPANMRALASQMQRSAISITSNIAEGFGRQSVKDKKHFYVISRGSITELQNQLLISRDIALCKKTLSQELAELTITVHKLTTGLIKSIEKRST